jgi:hypothetical protein
MFGSDGGDAERVSRIGASDLGGFGSVVCIGNSFLAIQIEIDLGGEFLAASPFVAPLRDIAGSNSGHCVKLVSLKFMWRTWIERALLAFFLARPCVRSSPVAIAEELLCAAVSASSAHSAARPR